MSSLAKKETVGTAVVLWEDELAAEASAGAKDEKVGGNYFSTKGGTISFAGASLGNTIDVVVAGAIYDRAYYPGSFGDAKTPACYSFSKDGVGMVPHPDVQDKQADSCDACPMNQFGSARVGKGKACREYRRLALISADNLQASEVPEATIGLFKVPPTSMRGYGEYVRSIAEVHKRPPWAMITEIKVLPDPQKQVVVSFKPASQLSQDVAMAVKARAEAVTDALMAPYPVFTEAAAEAPKAPAKAAKFGVKK
jgi:hypothetical protein